MFENLNFGGLLIGLATFIIIGIFHPLVIKGEYYFGEKIKWVFVLVGLIFLILALFTDSLTYSCWLGVTSFSSFWGVKEVKEQVKRVERGWFPANPKRNKKGVSK